MCLLIVDFKNFLQDSKMDLLRLMDHYLFQSSDELGEKVNLLVDIHELAAQRLLIPVMELLKKCNVTEHNEGDSKLNDKEM